MRTFAKIMRNRIENWEYLLSNDPNGETIDVELVKHSLREDKNIIRDMADELARTNKSFNRVEFFKDCGLIQG